MLLALLLAQLAALVVLTRRLLPGRHRLPPVEPRPDGLHDTSVTVVVPTRNEAERLGPCLDGLLRQGAPLTEVLFVDGHSTDATPALIDAAAAQDQRVRRVEEPPRPPGAVGRPWAIAAGCALARGEWILVVDADTAPREGMVAGVVAAARQYALDVSSFAPRIVAPGFGARLLQPAFLTTLVYRFGPAGLGDPDPERAMANGQCLLMRRAVLEREGGYAVAAMSYCDDIRIVRHLASHGARVGFLDGPRLFDVVMYPTARETWHGWPRSLNMRDATAARWRWLDAAFLILVQALPLPLLIGFAVAGAPAGVSHEILSAMIIVNVVLVGIRVLIARATAHSFARRGLAYWLAPFADVAAVLRVVETVVRRPREWRGQPRAELAAR